MNHLIWVNAGTFIVALLLPMKTLADKGTKLVLLVFFTAITLADTMVPHYEFRQFLDVLPISVFYVYRAVQSWQGREPQSGGGVR